MAGVNEATSLPLVAQEVNRASHSPKETPDGGETGRGPAQDIGVEWRLRKAETGIFKQWLRPGHSREVSSFQAWLVVVHDGLAPGLSPADNEMGWRMALAKLAALVETGPR